MSEVVSAASVPADAVYPPSISISELWPWALFATALLLLIYFVGVGVGVDRIAELAGGLLKRGLADAPERPGRAVVAHSPRAPSLRSARSDSRRRPGRGARNRPA